ncbi:putative Carrier domain-containing protein [Seiridium unicorne]|uniref:Carrier domain-containing protein n=1 Tax=Seiridium unicorne TaxID=138068 RepID=A0ABR2UJ20_9PEZI
MKLLCRCLAVQTKTAVNAGPKFSRPSGKERGLKKKMQGCSKPSVDWDSALTESYPALECAKRWQHVLGPEFKHSPWTPAEDAKLLKGVAQHGNNWKQIGTSELPDRSSHDIRNRSLLLERRSRNKTVKQLNPSHDVDHTVGKHADGSERYEFKNDDNNTRDDHSDYATPDSLMPQLPPEITRGSLVKHYTTPAAEPMGCHGAERLRYPQRPSNVTQGVHESLGLGWTGSVEHSQPHPELLTPEDIRMSWLDPFQASASSLTSPQYPWWSGTPTEELNFHNPGSLDMGLFSLPETNTVLSGRESIHDSLDVVEGPSHDESGRDDDGRGSITLTLDQVDPVVARRIIGSVLEHSAAIVGANMTAFVPPALDLDPTSGSAIRSLPELVDFHYEKNPDHLFCLQAERNNPLVPISYGKLFYAVVRCQAWLEEQAIGSQPTVNLEGQAEKCAPVAIFMESHVGLVVFLLACMGKGVPVVLLSVRLSAPAVHHLIRETGAKLMLISSSLQLLAADAFQKTDNNSQEGVDEGVAPRICLVPGYHEFFEDVKLTRSNDLVRAAHSNHFVSEDDRQVLILHSSGTSGLPKPIPCSHRYLLSYATCQSFESAQETHSLAISTLPLFHGFGLVSICLALGAGKPVCIPLPSTIPTGASVAALIQESGAKGLMTVPSIIEEIEALPESRGHGVLRELDFVAFGAGMLKTSVGERLELSGVRLINQYGSTETGPLTDFLKPDRRHDWRQFRLRSDIIGPLQVQLHRADTKVEQPELSQSDAEPKHSYSYKISMQPFGWRARFELQDLILTKREWTLGTDIAELDFAVAGRTDDLICLATGEKVRPTILESLLRQQDGVKDVSVFGDNRFELGVIIEPVKEIKGDELESFKDFCWSVIQDTGRQMDAHARITSPAAILIVSPGDLPRSDKGSILRQAVTRKFASEIEVVYRNLEAITDAPPLDLSAIRSSIGALAKQNVRWQGSLDDWSDDDDFFAHGMDSLQATRLRRLLVASVRATHLEYGAEANYILPADEIANDFVYLHPSISALAEVLVPQGSKTNGALSDAQIVENLVAKYTNEAKHNHDDKSVVALTGTTGSLGSFLLERLLMDDSVGHIICLNRPSSEDPIERQKRAMRVREIAIPDDAWTKVEVHQTNTAAVRLGLEEAVYEPLAARVTHIVHIAWPMNFKMSLPSFDAAFKSLHNLIELALRARSLQRLRKPRLLFTSSISTVGNYPSVMGEAPVPEVFVEDSLCTLGLGYAKAKLVCEKMIERAASEFHEMEAGFARLGQISGASSGYWNADEHFVAVCASSVKVKKLPDLRGTLSWLPVDLAAKAISEIIFSRQPLRPVYHLENPTRQNWEDVIGLLSKELQIPSSSIIPVDDWLSLVESTGEYKNPARGLAHFLAEDFIKMSCGSVVLDTTNSRSISPTIAGNKSVPEEGIKAYISYWRKIKQFV